MFRFLIVLSFLIVVVAATADSRIAIRDIEALTFYKGQWTTARRTTSIPQLQCVGGSAAGVASSIVNTIQCRNQGFSGTEHQWRCESSLNDNYKLGSVTVSCEGYEYPGDPLVLTGSCGLKYTLDYTDAYYQRRTPNFTPQQCDTLPPGVVIFALVFAFGLMAIIIISS